ncbi:596_t:CDS:2, partial [Acaulospora colombiana]
HMPVVSREPESLEVSGSMRSSPSHSARKTGGRYRLASAPNNQYRRQWLAQTALTGALKALGDPV